MYATAWGLSNKGPRTAWWLARRGAGIKKGAGCAIRARVALVPEPATLMRRPLRADYVSGVVQFLVQHALFVGGEAAAVLRGHVVCFLMDHLEPMMQRRAIRRRVVPLIHAL